MSTAQEPAAQITNTLFPPPPEFYKHFTDDNVARYEELTSNGAGPSRSPRLTSGGITARAELSAEERQELERLTASLGPPRSDWIEEEGRWVTFGEMSTTRPHIPTAADIGLTPLLDPDEPPQKSLTPLLHSFLHTLLLLLDVLTGSARPPHELAAKGWGHEGDQYIQHMTNLAANIMVTANLHREAQGEATLVLLMEKQLDIRRAQTEALKNKCRNISAKIQALKLETRQVLGDAVGDDRAMAVDTPL